MTPEPIVLGLIGITTAAISLAGYTVRLKLKKRRGDNNDLHPNHVVDGQLVCRKEKFDSRLATLEEHRLGVDSRLGKFEKKIDTVA